MKLYRGLTVMALLLSGLVLAACGANGGGAQSPTVSAPGATQPANSPQAPTEAAPGYPSQTLVPTLPGYPGDTPVAGAGGGYPYPAASGTPVDAATLDLVKQDLAKRLSVTVDQITVVSSTPTEWPDSSLGCPQPGEAYSQIVTPGYLILLSLGQKQYEYHTDLSATIVFCTK